MLLGRVPNFMSFVTTSFAAPEPRSRSDTRADHQMALPARADYVEVEAPARRRGRRKMRDPKAQATEKRELKQWIRLFEWEDAVLGRASIYLSWSSRRRLMTP